jgi:hypothetical protein
MVFLPDLTRIQYLPTFQYITTQCDTLYHQFTFVNSGPIPGLELHWNSRLTGRLACAAAVTVPSGLSLWVTVLAVRGAKKQGVLEAGLYQAAAEDVSLSLSLCLSLSPPPSLPPSLSLSSLSLSLFLSLSRVDECVSMLVC